MAPIYPGIETIRCNLCGADDTRLLFKLPVHPYYRGVFNRDEWDIVRCRRCGLVYENPRSDEQARQYVYSFENEGDRRFLDDWFLDNADLNRSHWRQILKVLAKFKRGGTLIDVGCGAGTFLEEARRGGYQVMGQEVAPFFLKYCQETLGLKMYGGELESLNLPAHSMDIVTAFDVIEHHPDPSRLLAEFHRLVKPDGMVVISTHDIGNWFARHYGVRWRYLGAIAHITYFTRQTLAQMLEKAGFRVVYMGGGHTLDTSPAREWRNRFSKFWVLIALRALVIYIYKPLSVRLPFLTRWSFPLRGSTINHQKLLIRSGEQVVMDDEMVAFAVPAQGKAA